MRTDERFHAAFSTVHKTHVVDISFMILSRMTMSSRSLLFALLGFLFLVSSAVAGTTEEGLKWLAQKKLEDGVVSLPSGLMYKEERPGTGTPAPRLLQTACSEEMVVIFIEFFPLLTVTLSPLFLVVFRKVSYDQQSLQMPLQWFLD